MGGFVEKPDLPTAERYLASGEYLWNSGMFFLTAGRMLEEARRHLPALGALLDAAVAAKDPVAAIAAGYRDVPSISIDTGIMEKASGLRVVPGAFGWNDVGSWAALPAVRPPDARGNVVLGGATLIDGDGNIVVAEEGAPFVGVVGVRDLVSSPPATRCWSSPRTRRRTCARSSRPRSRPAATISCRNATPWPMNPRVFREYDIRGVAEADFPDDFVADLGRADRRLLRRRGRAPRHAGARLPALLAAHPRHLQARAARRRASTSSTSASCTRPGSTSRCSTWRPTAAS